MVWYDIGYDLWDKISDKKQIPNPIETLTLLIQCISDRNILLCHMFQFFVNSFLKVINFVNIFTKSYSVAALKVNVRNMYMIAISFNKNIPWGICFFLFLRALQELLFSFRLSFLSGFYWSLQEIESFFFPVNALEGWRWSVFLSVERAHTLCVSEVVQSYFLRFLMRKPKVSVFRFIRNISDILINFYWLFLFYS